MRVRYVCFNVAGAQANDNGCSTSSNRPLPRSLASQDNFAANAITGELLLELSADDLDYMNITALGHRKLIMRAVQRLRGGVPLVATASTSASQGASASSKPGPQHWSAHDPLAGRYVRGSTATLSCRCKHAAARPPLPPHSATELPVLTQRPHPPAPHRITALQMKQLSMQRSKQLSWLGASHPARQLWMKPPETAPVRAFTLAHSC